MCFGWTFNGFKLNIGQKSYGRLEKFVSSAKFGIVIIRIQDAIEESLDVIDDRYASVSKVLETPLFYDSPEIRKVYKE